MGWKQRMGLGIAFIHNPQIILLDEPTNALDPEASISLLKVIKNLNQLHGTTFLISSHQLSEVNDMANQVIILKDGQLVYNSALTGELVETASWQAIYQQVNS